LAAGKVETRERGIRRTPRQQLMSKLDRRNQARQKQLLKHQERAQATSIFSGQNGAPRHVAIVPLSAAIDTWSAIRGLNDSVDALNDVSPDGISRVRIDRFRQNVMYIPANYELINALDICRVADFVVFILPTQEEVDEEGETLLRAIESQGVSNIIVIAQVGVYLAA
jgi:pre-rRNA-processing protein TSR1